MSLQTGRCWVDWIDRTACNAIITLRSLNASCRWVRSIWLIDFMSASCVQGAQLAYTYETCTFLPIFFSSASLVLQEANCCSSKVVQNNCRQLKLQLKFGINIKTICFSVTSFEGYKQKSLNTSTCVIILLYKNTIGHWQNYFLNW